jgi:hypothetical protein
MKNRIKFLSFTLLCAAALMLLAGCGSGVTFSAPEIDPPADLVPDSLPEGYDLVKGYKIPVGSIEMRFLASEAGEDGRVLCDLGLTDAFFDLKSPAGNPIVGVHYQNGDHLLLIGKSSFPGGSLEDWRSIYEDTVEPSPDCGCGCCCPNFSTGFGDLLRGTEIEGFFTVAGTDAALLEGALGKILVFVRGDDLLTVEGDLSTAELLKIAAGLLKN